MPAAHNAPPPRDAENRQRQKADAEALKAVRFMAIKAAIFILLPLACALLAVWLYL